MASRAEVPTIGVPITDLYDGLVTDGESVFSEPYDEEPS